MCSSTKTIWNMFIRSCACMDIRGEIMEKLPRAEEVCVDTYHLLSVKSQQLPSGGRYRSPETRTISTHGNNSNKHDTIVTMRDRGCDTCRYILTVKCWCLHCDDVYNGCYRSWSQTAVLFSWCIFNVSMCSVLYRETPLGGLLSLSVTTFCPCVFITGPIYCKNTLK